LRTYLGTGDRNNLSEFNAPTCRLSNPRGCAAAGCAVSETIDITRNGVLAATSKATYANFAYTALPTASTYGSGGAACTSNNVTLTWSVTAANGCPTSSTGKIIAKCDASSGSFKCNPRDSWEGVSTSFQQDDWLKLESRRSPQVPQNRGFYGFNSFSSSSATRSFENEAQANAYDSARYTEADLVDVTSITASNVAGGASAGGNGWRLRYGTLDESTATGSALISGCVIWNSFVPAGNGPLCSTVGTNIARLHEAHFVTGRPSCADDFEIGDTGVLARTIEREVPSIPGEPATQYSIIDGKIGAAVVMSESSGSPVKKVAVTEGQDSLEHIFQLELDRRGHECRHKGVGCK
jgi:type IV pilus assembly protein PilY1